MEPLEARSHLHGVIKNVVETRQDEVGVDGLQASSTGATQAHRVCLQCGEAGAEP
jgi:hypothetical protein